MFTNLGELFPPITEQRGADPTLLRDELLHGIRNAINNTPRSLQARIGPSEIGTPCDRKLGYKLTGTPEANATGDHWLATIGTAVHAWLQEIFTMANAGQDAARWLTEFRVNAGTINGQDLEGSCDLYDRVTATVVDWKICGKTSLDRYRKNGPGPQYRIQAHTYGTGWIRSRNVPVDRVAIMFLPRNGPLTETVWWSEDHDPTITTTAITRVDALAAAAAAFGPQIIPSLHTADSYCTYCPWYQAGADNLTTSCPGHTDRQNRDNRARNTAGAGLIPA
jgi:hypothetical protein